MKKITIKRALVTNREENETLLKFVVYVDGKPHLPFETIKEVVYVDSLPHLTFETIKEAEEFASNLKKTFDKSEEN